MSPSGALDLRLRDVDGRPPVSSMLIARPRSIRLNFGVFFLDLGSDGAVTFVPVVLGAGAGERRFNPARSVAIVETLKDSSVATPAMRGVPTAPAVASWSSVAPSTKAFASPLGAPMESRLSRTVSGATLLAAVVAGVEGAPWPSLGAPVLVSPDLSVFCLRLPVILRENFLRVFTLCSDKQRNTVDCVATVNPTN